MYTENIMNIIAVIGVISFAISGAMAAVNKRMDPFGIVVLAVITASGGGIIRDVILGILPPNAFTDCTYILIASAAALTVYFTAHIFKDSYMRNTAMIDGINNIFDAIGLGIFIVVGSQTAIDYGFAENSFLVIFIGMITGIGGGFLRDIFINEIPFVLKKRIYALAALAGSILYCIMYKMRFDYTLSVIVSAGTTFLLRILATHYRWNIPPAY